jgi:hypothetical protein
MLSLYERYLFILFAVLCVVAAYNTFYEMILVIGRGQGTLGWDKLPQRAIKGVLALFTQGRIHAPPQTLFLLPSAHRLRLHLLFGFALNWWIHASWWLALGLILVFIPYFPTTKHAHLFMGPLNFMTRPERPALGTLDKIDFDNESIEQFGANTLSHLSQTQILDAFACIMCNRCQDACPAYATGKELSPAALEINKRYYIRDDMSGLA